MADIKNYTLNFGPQHPAAHGVLRLVLELDGEVIQRADPHIGLLHRATEKLAETRTYIQSLPYMDRLDYVSMMCNEHAYCLAIEKLIGVDVPIRAQYIRVMFAEITRLMNHLMWLGAHGLDCGAMNIFIYCFREREDLFDMYEAASGARMHAAYFRPGGVYRDLPDAMPQYRENKIRSAKSTGERNENRHGSLLDFIDDFVKRFPSKVDEYETLLTDNRIWKQRTVGIGVVTPERAKNARLQRPDAARLRHPVGPAQAPALRRLRQAGFRHPARRQRRHLRPLSRARRGDAAGQPHHPAMRRLAEGQSGAGDHVANHKVAPPSRVDMKTGMEDLIHHFKLFTEGFRVPEGRGLRGGRASEGRVRHLHRQRRRQQAVPPQDPRAGLPAPGGARRDGTRSHDGRRGGRDRHAWTSSSGRSTDEQDGRRSGTGRAASRRRCVLAGDRFGRRREAVHPAPTLSEAEPARPSPARSPSTRRKARRRRVIA